MTTTTHSDSAIIRDFLALPKTSMQSAVPLHEDIDNPNVWRLLRASLRRDAIHWDMAIRLRADADGWREGVIVRV